MSTEPSASQTTSVSMLAFATIMFAGSAVIDSVWRVIPLVVGLVLLVAGIAQLRRSGDGSGGWLPSKEAKQNDDPR